MSPPSVTNQPVPEWTLLSNHGHVLVCLARNSDVTIRDVALMVGITERATQRIITELEAEGMIERERVGRRNTYFINYDAPMRHPNESQTHVGSFLRSLGLKSSRR